MGQFSSTAVGLVCRALPWACVVPVVACQGDVGVGYGPPRGASASTLPQAGGAGVPEGADTVAASGAPIADAATDAVRMADATMQAANADLFEVALRYFPGDVAGGGPKRLARLTRTQLDLTTRALLPSNYDASAVETLPPDPLQTNYEYADNLRVNPANFTPYTNWVQQMLTGVRADPASVVACPLGADTVCLDAEARNFVTRAFRGVVTDAQLSRFAGWYTAATGELGWAAATADLVDLTLTSPSYLFLDEVQTDRSGVLLAAQRLQYLTYALADAPPEALGLALADAELLLSTPEGGRELIDRVLQTPQAREKLLRFFMAWLEIRQPAEFGIAADIFPEFTPQVAVAAVEQTRAFLRNSLWGDAPTLKGVTQSTSSPVPAELAAIYGPGSATGARVELDPTERLGIFTQPAVIASHSGPTTTRLVKRGVFFTRKVMCLPLGMPPEGIDTTVPQTAGATERERIEGVTAMPTCQGCHAYINPFGFMQENYDAIGRYRTVDEGGLPVDAAISVAFLDEGTLNSASFVEALQDLTASARFQQCFARQILRFYMGREERPEDDPVLRQMFFNLADGDVQDILTSLRVLAASPSFSQRTETP